MLAAPSLPGPVLLGKHQPRRVHVAAGDVGMDVDGACHHDLAGKIVGLGGGAICRRVGDAIAVDPDVGDFVAAVLRIDDAAALQPDHGAGSLSASRSSASAAVTVCRGAEARTSTSVPMRWS